MLSNATLRFLVCGELKLALNSGAVKEYIFGKNKKALLVKMLSAGDAAHRAGVISIIFNVWPSRTA